MIEMTLREVVGKEKLDSIGSSDPRKHGMAREGIDSSLTEAVNNEVIPPSPIILNSTHELRPQAYIMLNLINSNHSRWKICTFALVRSDRVSSVQFKLHY